MTTNSEHSLSPLRPYDESMRDQSLYSYYDNIPYTWNSDNEKRLTFVSGNIIKSYLCRIKEPYQIKH